MNRRIDLTGQRFGRWKVEEFAGKDKRGNALWSCVCDCGTHRVIRGDALRSGSTKSCGCLSKHRRMEALKQKDLPECEKPRRLRDLTGQRFGKWQVISYMGSSKSGNSLWKCLCDCGSVRIVQSGGLTGGTSKSCGCSKGLPIHNQGGDSRSRLYRIWYHMRYRCNNKNNTSYKNYGGRGISVCKEWNTDFQAFRAWALSHGYQDNLSIDRIDSNGNYCPQNCRWATRKEQNNNRRNTVFLEINGVCKPLAQWSEETGISQNKLYMRWRNGYKGDELLRDRNVDRFSSVSPVCTA